MLDKVTKSSQLPDLETYIDRETACELARRSILGAPVYTVISLIVLAGTPMLMDYGWWSAVEALTLILLGGVRVWFAKNFEEHYAAIGEKAVVQFSILTALQSLTLGVLTGMVIWQYWAAQEVILTIVLAIGCVAAGTSALSVRRSAHIIFLACVLGPFGVAVLLVGGVTKAMLILGFLSLMAFLVQDGGHARSVFFNRLKEHYGEKLDRLRSDIELQAKKEFIRDIGHEVRTPVNSIVGMTALLLDERLNKRAYEIALNIRSSGVALLDLTGNIPGSIKAAHEIPKAQLESLSMSEHINKILDLFRHPAAAKNIEITAQLDAIPENIIFDEESNLEQVLVNLLTNAMAYTEQGSIALNAACETREDGDLIITFSLSDTGVGIPSEQLAALFSPFSQAGAKTSGKFGGGGLGLPLCKGLVELMGGEIWVDSNEGEGTTVSFTIRAELDPADTSWQPDEKIAGGLESVNEVSLSEVYPHRILVVDDDDIHRQIVCIQLQKMGYEADEAADGEEAVAAVLQGNYDVIFMDLRMPNMNGTESSKWIREHYGNHALRIIALTGDATIEAREKSIRAGMDNFVTKPVQPKDLEAILYHNFENTEVGMHA